MAMDKCVNASYWHRSMVTSQGYILIHIVVNYFGTKLHKRQIIPPPTIRENDHPIFPCKFLCCLNHQQ